MSQDTAVVLSSDQPDLLNQAIQQGLVIDPEVRLIGDNHLTPEQDAYYRGEFRALAIKATKDQLANIDRQLEVLGESRNTILNRLAMAEASTNGHAYPTDLSGGSRQLAASQDLTERESAICQLIPADGITVMSLGKELADSGHFSSELIARRKSITGHLQELEERGIVTSRQSGRWTKWYLSAGFPPPPSEALAQEGSSRNHLNVPNPRQFWDIPTFGNPGFRPGSATEVVLTFIKKAPVRGRSLEEIETADLDLKGANLKSTVSRLRSLGMIVNRGERGAPHYYLATNDPGEKPVAQLKTGIGGPVADPRPGKRGAKQAMVLQAVCENQALPLSDICQVLADNPEYNSSGKTAKELYGAVYQALLTLVDKDQVATFSGNARQKAYYLPGGTATNPFLGDGDKQSVPARSSRTSSRKSPTKDDPESGETIAGTYFPGPLLDLTVLKDIRYFGGNKRNPNLPERYTELLDFCAKHFGPRFRLSQIVRYYSVVLPKAGFHIHGSTSTLIHQGLVKAIERSSVVTVDSDDHDIIVVLDKGKRAKTKRDSAGAAEDDDDESDTDFGTHDPPPESLDDIETLDDPTEEEIEELEDDAPAQIISQGPTRTYEDDLPPAPPEPPATSNKPVAENEADIDDMIMSIFESVPRDLSIDNVVEKALAGHGRFIFEPGTIEQEAESLVSDALLRLTYDQGKLEANDDDTWSLPR